MMPGRLLVLGGGLTGLSAALAVRNQFEQIVIIERDEYSTTADERRFTPQGHHIHVLLARGVTELFHGIPELPAWFDEAGLPESDLTADIWVAQAGRWLPRRACGIQARSCTRPLLERMLLRVVRKHRNISILEKTKVVAMMGSRVAEGVLVRNENGETYPLPADLVVDARGRNARVIQGIEAMGHGRTQEIVVDADVSYASCLFKPKAGVTLPCNIIAAIGSLGKDPRIGTLMSVGKNEWLATLINYAGSPAPKDTEQFLEQAAALCVPDLHEYLVQGEPISTVTRYKNTANRRRLFQKLKSWPERYVVLGDAACCFNPRFGQGITMAAIGTKLLANKLASHLASHGSLQGFSRPFQRALDRKLDSPWQMATLEDKGWIAFSRGANTWTDKLRVAASRHLLATAAADYDTYIRVNRVAHMLDPIRALINPRTLTKLLLPMTRSLR